MTFTGTLGDVNTALNGLIYTPESGFEGDDTLTISASRQGSGYSSSPNVVSASVDISVGAAGEMVVDDTEDWTVDVNGVPYTDSAQFQVSFTTPDSPAVVRVFYSQATRQELFTYINQTIAGLNWGMQQKGVSVSTKQALQQNVNRLSDMLNVLQASSTAYVSQDDINFLAKMQQFQVTGKWAQFLQNGMKTFDDTTIGSYSDAQMRQMLQAIEKGLEAKIGSTTNSSILANLQASLAYVQGLESSWKNGVANGANGILNQTQINNLLKLLFWVQDSSNAGAVLLANLRAALVRFDSVNSAAEQTSLEQLQGEFAQESSEGSYIGTELLVRMNLDQVTALYNDPTITFSNKSDLGYLIEQMQADITTLSATTAAGVVAIRTRNQNLADFLNQYGSVFYDMNTRLNAAVQGSAQFQNSSLRSQYDLYAFIPVRDAYEHAMAYAYREGDDAEYQTALQQAANAVAQIGTGIRYVRAEALFNMQIAKVEELQTAYTKITGIAVNPNGDIQDLKSLQSQLRSSILSMSPATAQSTYDAVEARMQAAGGKWAAMIELAELNQLDTALDQSLGNKIVNSIADGLTISKEDVIERLENYIGRLKTIIADLTFTTSKLNSLNPGDSAGIQRSIVALGDIQNSVIFKSLLTDIAARMETIKIVAVVFEEVAILVASVVGAGAVARVAVTIARAIRIAKAADAIAFGTRTTSLTTRIATGAAMYTTNVVAFTAVNSGVEFLYHGQTKTLGELGSDLTWNLLMFGSLSKLGKLNGKLLKSLPKLQAVTGTATQLLALQGFAEARYYIGHGEAMSSDERLRSFVQNAAIFAGVQFATFLGTTMTQGLRTELSTIDAADAAKLESLANEAKQLSGQIQKQASQVILGEKPTDALTTEMAQLEQNWAQQRAILQKNAGNSPAARSVLAKFKTETVKVEGEFAKNGVEISLTDGPPSFRVVNARNGVVEFKAGELNAVKALYENGGTFEPLPPEMGPGYVGRINGKTTYWYEANSLPEQGPGGSRSLKVIADGCFAAGTKLWTPQGFRNVEEIQPDDFVYARNELDPEGPVETKRVEKTFERTGRVLHLHTAGEVIRTTPEHPFYVEGKGWTHAGALKEGNCLHTLSGRWVKLDEVYDTGCYETVYNVSVAEWHTYFVGHEAWGFAVWAHNRYRTIKMELTQEEVLQQLGGSANEPSWKQLEILTAKLFETAQGETTIDAQFTQGVPFIVRGFDVFSFSVSKTGEVQLYLTEVKDYASLVPTSKFSAFGVNRASTLRLNIQKAVEAVQKEISNGKIPRNVGEEIISQLDNAGYQIRLVGNSKTVFTKDAIQAIEAATGAKVTEVIKVEVK